MITFVMKYENCTFPEALKMLAEKAGVELPQAEYSEEVKRRESRRQRLLKSTKKRQNFYYVLLPKRAGYQGKGIFGQASAL